MCLAFKKKKKLTVMIACQYIYNVDLTKKSVTDMTQKYTTSIKKNTLMCHYVVYFIMIKGHLLVTSEISLVVLENMALRSCFCYCSAVTMMVLCCLGVEPISVDQLQPINVV